MPSEEVISVNYVSLNDRLSINKLVHNLDKIGCISGPQYDEYLGLKRGVYFVGNSDILEGVKYEKVNIDSNSYVMKYIILKAVKRKIQELAKEGKLFLPRNWYDYSQIMLCKNTPIKRSAPWGLFTIRECLSLRIEHLPVEDKNELFILADVKIKRFSNLSLARIVDIMTEQEFDTNTIESLAKRHFYRCEVNGRHYDCLLLSLNNEVDYATVMIKDSKQKIPTSKIFLNPHPKFTRDFIQENVGENLRVIDNIRTAIGRQRPKKKLESITKLVRDVLKEKGVFPIKISNVTYDFELIPLKFVLTGET